ncbi:hypothetical protein F5883DRAFT_596651 [Diaporthe sp. PMI_573]|nr:hypothetical protein F5883DRAFT_596651 [Diaporthaceae sp. PMI_573]
MGEVPIFLGSVPYAPIYIPGSSKPEATKRSVLKLFDPSNGLLTTPVEILANILKYIAEDKKALASLAFVNSDCRQLARSYQFSAILPRLQSQPLELLIRLVKEGQERDINHAQRQPFPLCQDFKDLPAVEKDKSLEDANQAYFDVYIPDIGFVLRKSLPNLEYLAWEDPVLLDRPFFNSLVHSSIKQLKLCKVRVLEDFEVEIPPSGAWPLRSLDIEMELAQRGQCPTADANSGEQHSLVDPRDGQPFERKDLHDTRPASQEMEVNFFRLSTQRPDEFAELLLLRSTPCLGPPPALTTRLVAFFVFQRKEKL